MEATMTQVQLTCSHAQNMDPLFYINVPYNLGVYAVGPHLSVKTEDALKPILMFPSNSRSDSLSLLDLLKDYLGLFELSSDQVFPLYLVPNTTGDPGANYSFITLDAFLLILFTKAPANLTTITSGTRSQMVDFIRKSLSVLVTLLQVKAPPSCQGLSVPTQSEPKTQQASTSVNSSLQAFVLDQSDQSRSIGQFMSHLHHQPNHSAPSPQQEVMPPPILQRMRPNSQNQEEQLDEVEPIVRSELPGFAAIQAEIKNEILDYDESPCSSRK